MSSSVGMMKLPIYGKIQNVPNHQSETHSNLFRQALQHSRVSCIELPCLLNRHIFVLRVFANQHSRFNGSTEHGGEDNVELKTVIFQIFSSFSCLFKTFRCHSRILPAGELLFQIAFAFSMTEENHLPAVQHGAAGHNWWPGRCMRSRCRNGHRFEFSKGSMKHCK